MLSTRVPNARQLFNSPWQVMHDMLEQQGQPLNNDMGRYPIDIREDKDSVHIEAELPGFSSDQIDVTIEEGVLAITAERGTPKPEEGTQHHLRERRYTKMHRRFSLPKTIDAERVEANLTDGVLYLTLHKKEEVKPRKVQVAVAPGTPGHAGTSGHEHGPKQVVAESTGSDAAAQADRASADQSTCDDGSCCGNG